MASSVKNGLYYLAQTQTILGSIFERGVYCKFGELIPVLIEDQGNENLSCFFFDTSFGLCNFGSRFDRNKFKIVRPLTQEDLIEIRRQFEQTAHPRIQEEPHIITDYERAIKGFEFLKRYFQGIAA
jgi:hypothetical protein